MSSRTYTPVDFFYEFKSRRSKFSDEEFHNSPKAKKVQEIWVGSKFGLGFDSLFGSSTIVFDEDILLDYDILLEFNGEQFPFQITESQVPERKKGLEYSGKAEPLSMGEEGERGSIEGYDWIHEAIKKKVAKNYSGVDSLNLLVYANFCAWEFESEQLVERCNESAKKFASVWVVTGEKFCCIKQNKSLPNLKGWAEIPRLS